MERYKNKSGESGVSAYEIGEDYIKVKFSRTTRTYLYSYRKAGKFHVEKMKSLALRGSGLNSYINFNVKHLFE